MRYLALCTDYDGTIAHHGHVDEPTIAALEALKASGRRLILVTGREIDDLKTVFDRFDLFERVVAENGALIYEPGTGEERILGPAPAAAFVEDLRRRGVDRLSVGRCIVATWEPFERQVLESIRDLGLELQVIFNKGAVMVLPSGINKAFGLKAALAELDISVHNTVAVGDAENDHALLSSCECSAAVANALPAVKETVDIVLSKDHGAGVSELVAQMLDDDLSRHASRLQRHDILLGKDPRDLDVTLSPYDASALIVGTSGGGKSTIATGLVERLCKKGYNFCVIDPEGDYDALAQAAVLGSPDRAPSVDECMQLLAKPDQNAVFNLLGIKFADRPAFFMSLFARVRDLRTKTGRPHWLIVDEAHHVMPADWKPTDIALPQRLDGVFLVSINPAAVAKSALQLVETVIIKGDQPREMLREFAQAVSIKPPESGIDKVPVESALLWHKDGRDAPQLVRIEPNKTERKRHLRKYAEGVLGQERSFYFRGAEGKLKLRAQNLIAFTDLADGVDEDTWLYHWRRGDVSDWVRTCIKDPELAEKVAAIEHEDPDNAMATRQRVRELIEATYTLPAEASSA